MGLSFEEIEGNVVNRIVERNHKDITIILLLANDGREIIIRKDKNIDIQSFIDHTVKVSGSIEGNTLTIFEIAII
jgi:hypothetical protein